LPIYIYFLLFYSKQMKSSMPSPAALARIRRLSSWVRLMCAGAAAVLLALPLLFWSQPGWVARVAQQEWGVKVIQLDALSRLGGWLATATAASIGMWALWEIWRLFGCYARGELLSHRPAMHLHRLGLALISLAAAMPLSQTLSVLALTLGNPPGQRQLMVGLSSQHYLSLLLGLVLLALAQVMREAARVAEENAEFI
jgi:Protein of unknown function (DUF2975)